MNATVWYGYKIQIQVFICQISPGLTQPVNQVASTTVFMNLLNNLEDWCYPGLFQFSNLLQLLNNQLCQDSNVSFFWKGE